MGKGVNHQTIILYFEKLNFFNQKNHTGQDTIHSLQLHFKDNLTGINV